MSMEKVWHSGSTPVILIPETAIGGEKREGANMKIMKPGKRPYCQNNQSKRAGGMAQVGKHLANVNPRVQTQYCQRKGKKCVCVCH
jgi:hypothetical protein